MHKQFNTQAKEKPLPIRAMFKAFKWHLLAIVILIFVHGAVHADESNPAINDIETTIMAFQESADHVKSTNPAAYALYTNAIRDLNKYLPGTEAPAKAIAPLVLATKTLRKMFKGQSKYDAKTGVLSLGYDFNDPACVQDFKIDGTQPDLAKGALIVPLAESLTHKVVWGSQLTITGEVKCGNRNGDQIAFTNGLKFSEGNYNAWFLNMTGPGVANVQARINDDYGHTEDSSWVSFTITIVPKTISAKWGDAKLGAATTVPFSGGLKLLGGAGGNAYRNLIMSGIPDQEWLNNQIALAK